MKTVLAGTKRRRDSVRVSAPYSTAALSRRMTRMGRQLKQANPTHLFAVGANTAFPDVSTSGTLYDICSPIAQGDDYLNRFASHVDVTHMNFKCCFLPGTSSASPANVRVTLFKAQSGLAFASNMTGSYSPIVTGTAIQLLYDKFFQIAPSATTQAFPTVLHMSKKLKHRQKFSGTGASTTTAESIYLLVQSGSVTGSAAPRATNGVLEVYFKP
uniref:Uncharacterized protein n=1 Tax=uncultured prokaryote TaxID=198431 RepID=A0A0H5Q608_9ZZZZ|nr:hypothetical protein [uncultured prokaryote]